MANLEIKFNPKVFLSEFRFFRRISINNKQLLLQTRMIVWEIKER